MTRHFENELRDLKFSLLAMAGQVEEMIALTHQSLIERSNPKAERVAVLDKTVDEFELRLDQSYVARTIRLASLAPSIMEAILNGQEPGGMSLLGLRRDMPMLWQEQQKLLGLEAN